MVARPLNLKEWSNSSLYSELNSDLVVMSSSITPVNRLRAWFLLVKSNQLMDVPKLGSMPLEWDAQRRIEEELFVLHEKSPFSYYDSIMTKLIGIREPSLESMNGEIVPPGANVFDDLLQSKNHCHKCNSTDVGITLHQMRSADEPMNVYMNCNACRTRKRIA